MKKPSKTEPHDSESARYRLREQDDHATAVEDLPDDNADEIHARLRRLERWGGGLFVVTPLVLLVLGGRELARWIILIWPAYAVAYILVFRAVSARFDDPDWRFLSRTSRRYTLRRLCGAIVFLYALGVALHACTVLRESWRSASDPASTTAPAGASSLAVSARMPPVRGFVQA